MSENKFLGEKGDVSSQDLQWELELGMSPEVVVGESAGDIARADDTIPFPERCWGIDGTLVPDCHLNPR